MLPQAEPFGIGANARVCSDTERFCYLKGIAPWPTRFRQSLTGVTWSLTWHRISPPAGRKIPFFVTKMLHKV